MPNPAHESFSIIKNANSEKPVNARITNITGEVISDVTLTPNSQIDCGQWKNGIYFIHFNDGSDSFNLKFIKQ
jgi:hypothetical protein